MFLMIMSDSIDRLNSFTSLISIYSTFIISLRMQIIDFIIKKYAHCFLDLSINSLVTKFREIVLLKIVKILCFILLTLILYYDPNFVILF